MPLLRALADLVFPPRCEVCRFGGAWPLCGACRAAFRPIIPPVCPRCGRPVPGPAASGDACGLCRARRPAFAVARAAGVYEGRLREAIHALKFDRRRALAAPLAAFLRAAAGPLLEEADLLVPVPLHPGRLRERGFNQSRLLADAVARGTGIPVVEALARVRPTEAQSTLARPARRDNVRGAFAARRPLPGRRVAVIDDVIATGSTASACAEALHRAGAATVVALAVAMSVPDRDVRTGHRIPAQRRAAP